MKMMKMMMMKMKKKNAATVEKAFDFLTFYGHVERRSIRHATFCPQFNITHAPSISHYTGDVLIVVAIHNVKHTHFLPTHSEQQESTRNTYMLTSSVDTLEGDVRLQKTNKSETLTRTHWHVF